MAISKTQSTAMLMSLKSLLGLGHALPRCLLMLEEAEENGSVKKELSKINYLINEEHMHAPEALNRYKVISKEEMHMIEGAANTRQSILDILKIRSISANAEKTMMALFAWPIIAFPIGLMIVHLAQPRFYGLANMLIEKAEAVKGISLRDDISIPYFMQSQDTSLTIAIIYLAIVTFIVGGYFYLLQRYPQYIYKFFKLKTYDDIPIILLQMNGLKKAGKNPPQIAKILGENPKRAGWKTFYAIIARNINANEKMYRAFEIYNFPKDVTMILKSAEMGKNFWDVVDSVIDYAIETNIDKNRFLKTMFGNLLTAIGFMIIIFFIGNVLLMVWIIQDISTAMM